LRVLFYGQSKTWSHWTDLAAEHLRRTYPHMQFGVRNMAIGGFSGKQIERTVEHDATEYYLISSFFTPMATIAPTSGSSR
jgi:hypothetical protein